MDMLFYISSIVAVAATAMVVAGKQAMHALLHLVVSLLAVAMVFYSLGAAFAAALEAIVYAGAIMVLMALAIMLLGLGKDSVRRERQWLPPRAWAGPGLLAAVLLGLLIHSLWVRQGGAPQAGAEIPPQQVGMAMVGPYVLGLELASMLLLSALVGAMHLAGRTVDLRPIDSATLAARARRPAFSVLENGRAKAIGLRGFSDWRNALRDYLRRTGIV